MKKTPTLFKLSDACRIQLDSCVDLLRIGFNENGYQWRKVNRTQVVHSAVKMYLGYLEQARKEWEAKQVTKPKHKKKGA